MAYLNRRALRLCRGRHADAEDLVQDTLERAFRHMDAFEMGTNFAAWLTRIMTNTFLNGVRRSVRERAAVEVDANAHVVARQTGFGADRAAPAPDAGVTTDALSDAVVYALENLPRDFRRVVVMSDLGEMPYKDIAVALDCPTGTVMSRLFRGRRLLQDQLRGPARQMGLHVALAA
ncbi:MAG: sigma-70 family RNA polymerase sigma factor [Deltaproteobacteria bacterium]|nr:sigma-70 family RNA polymerase sigma factor [Deltaproteobacteria bacterium]